MNKILLVFVVLAIVVIGVAGAVVGLRLIQGNSIKINTQVVAVTMSANNTVPFIGDGVRFTAVLSNSQVGVPMVFYSDISGVNASVAVVSTGANGIAVWDCPITNGGSFSVFPVAELP